MTDQLAKITASLEAVKARCTAAAERAGRSADEVSLMAVSKTWPAEVVALAVEAGHLLFGENRVQEGIDKIPQLPPNLEWHLIGHLQRNKIRKALPLFDTLHGVDSLKLANAIDRVAMEMGLRPQIFLEVNVGGEQSKFGFQPDQLRHDFEHLSTLQNLQIRGLMAIPPAVARPELARPYFRQLASLRDELAANDPQLLPQLSMGMSGDFEVAIEEGSHIVRIGSAIFGQRH